MINLIKRLFRAKAYCVRSVYVSQVNKDGSYRHCFECNDELNKEELFCSYCRRHGV